VTRISDLLAEGPTLSFEFFPPATAAGVDALDAAVAELAVLDPSFVSVTYGAGGSNRDRTRQIVARITESQRYPAMPHLTCIGHTREELVDLVDGYLAAGIENILALAGDPPADGSPAIGDFEHAADLVELIRTRSDAAVGVATS